ncbi:MAG: STAS/SEC14 domain-containing protein [Planctomycetota bacterium]|nr:STAS/SEC14 domain-containing protein [Planctomycetota bacterium]
MLQFEDHADQGYVAFTIDGVVPREDLEEALTLFEPLLEQHRRLGVLEHIVSFRGISPLALWRDLRFAARHLMHVGPVAVVSDRRYVRVWSKMAAPFWKAEVRFFPREELEEARAWLVEQMAHSA